MPSNLRLQLDVQSTQSFHPHKLATSTSPKQKMSLTQTYRIASTARGKLGMEASRPDHNLRLLVGHANLLDSLMVDLANAEREQEAWFNNTIRNASAQKSEESPKHIQWIDSIVEESDMYDDDSSDSESDSDDEEIIDARDFAAPIRRRSVSPPPPAREFDDEESEDEEFEDYDEDVEELALQRVSSRVPDLIHEHEHEDDESSDDESMPPSPTHFALQFNSKKAALAPLEYQDLAQKDLLSPTPSTPMITAF